MDVVWRSPKGVSLAISEIGIQFRLPSSFSNPAFIVFRITNPTVTIHQNNSNNSGDNVEGTSSRPLPSKGSSSGTPAAAAVKKGSKGGVAGTSSPLTSILSSPLILFSLRLLKLRIVRFTLKCLFYLEVRGLRVNFIVDTDTSAATIQYTHSLFTLKLGNSVKSSLSLESFEQGRKNFGLVLGISPFEVDLVEIKDAASPPTRRRLLKSDQESSLCLSINLDISKGKVWKPSLLVDVCGVVLYLGEMLKAVEMLKSFSICQKQQHPHILEQGIQSDSNFAGMSDDRRRNAPSKSASNINASSSCTSATSVATEEQIIPMLNEIFEKIMAGIKDICFFQPLVFVSITKTVIISSNLVDSIQDSTYFQCSIGEISISSAILDSQSQAKLLESWQGDVLMEWEDSDPVVDVNVCIKTFQVDMIESKTSVSTVFNILSVPRNGFRFNMQLVDTLDPGLDPNLQSKDEPRMGVSFR